MFSLEFRAEVNQKETRVMELSSSEDRMIVAGFVLAWYQRVTDGRSDGGTDCQTESIIANTALCIVDLSYARCKKNLPLEHRQIRYYTVYYIQCVKSLELWVLWK